MSDGLLKLRAKDAEDVQVLSAVLQDSIVPVCDMAFQPAEKTFIAVAQRLRREAGEGGAGERICCALTVKGVTGVKTHGVDLKQQAEAMLDLLAILPEQPTPVAAPRLTLIFAGDVRVRLEMDQWSVLVEDFGETWPALCRPCHEKPQG